MKSNLAEVFRKKWTVSGAVTEANTLQPLEGLTVVAMDFDHILGDDFLGKAVTDKKGRYSITFSWGKFRDILEFLPDVYVKIYDQNEKLLKDTHNEVMKNIASDIEINVEIDMRSRADKQEVGGFEIDPRAFAKATPEDILGLAQLMRGRKIKKETAEILKAINPKFTLSGIQDNNFCTTP